MTHQAETIPDAELESLFLWGGGRFTQGLEQFQLAHGTRLRAGRVAALVAALTWLPLLLLAVVEGVALGDRVEVPFLKDFLPYGTVPGGCAGAGSWGRGSRTTSRSEQWRSCGGPIFSLPKTRRR